MYPDEAFAEGRGSFLRPVPQPLGEPTDTPALTLSISCEYLPYIRGALQQLLLQATWATNDPDELRTTQGRMFNLITLFHECVTPIAFSCPYDFQAIGSDEHGWIHVDQTPYVPNALGVFVPLAGWFHTSSFYAAGGTWLSGVDIHLIPGSIFTVDKVEMIYNVHKGNFSHGTGLKNGIVLYNGASVAGTQLVASETDPDGSFKSITLTGSHTITEIRLIVRDEWDDTGHSPGTSEIVAINMNLTAGGCP